MTAKTQKAYAEILAEVDRISKSLTAKEYSELMDELEAEFEMRARAARKKITG